MNQIRKIWMIMKIKKINNNLDIDNKIIDIKFTIINDYPLDKPVMALYDHTP